MRLSTLALGVTALAGALPARAQTEIHIERGPRDRMMVMANDDSDRAVLGIGTSSGGKRDTLGLLVTSVASGGPAEAAGIEEGDRIAAVNGVNLRLAAPDAGERDMNNVLARRLVRELGKVKPGSEVELALWSGGKLRTVKVKTKPIGTLTSERHFARGRDGEDRAVLGLGVGGNGSRRDTLGLLLTSVSDGGPADKAGIGEGDRLQAINGVDLRVSREDAGDAYVHEAKGQRLRREMAKVKPGDEVEVKVWAGGQTRSIRVKSERASELYPRMGVRVFDFGDEGVSEAPLAPEPPLAPMAPMAPLPPRPPHLPRVEELRFDVNDGIDGDAIRQQVGDAVRRARVRVRERVKVLNDATDTEAPDDIDDDDDDGATMHAGNMQLLRGHDGMMAPLRVAALAEAQTRHMMSMDGLELSPVSEALAAYFGPESVGGMLVVETGKRWPTLRPGDVILRVDGHRLTRGEGLVIPLHDGTTPVELLRKGKRIRTTI